MLDGKEEMSFANWGRGKGFGEEKRRNNKRVAILGKRQKTVEVKCEHREKRWRIGLEVLNSMLSEFRRRRTGDRALKT